MAEQARKKRIAALAGIVTVFAKREGGEMEFRVKEKRTHRWWVRPWILDKSLPECNTAFKLQMELQKVCTVCNHKKIISSKKLNE